MGLGHGPLGTLVSAWPKLKEWRPVAEVGFKYEKYAVCVWRSVRDDGDTKTEKSRSRSPTALTEHHAQQAKQRLQAGKRWEDHDLVFATGTGRPLDAHNVGRSVRRITKKAGVPALVRCSS